MYLLNEEGEKNFRCVELEKTKRIGNKTLKFVVLRLEKKVFLYLYINNITWILSQMLTFGLTVNYLC